MRDAGLLTGLPFTRPRTNWRRARAPGGRSRCAVALAAAAPADGARPRSSRDGGGDAKSTTLLLSLIGYPKFGCRALLSQFVVDQLGLATGSDGEGRETREREGVLNQRGQQWPGIAQLLFLPESKLRALSSNRVTSRTAEYIKTFKLLHSWT